LGHCGFENIQNKAAAVLEGIDFNKAMMHGMMSFLLFSGALHVNLENLARCKWIISILATFGVIMSAFIVGGSTLDSILGCRNQAAIYLLFAVRKPYSSD